MSISEGTVIDRMKHYARQAGGLAIKIHGGQFNSGIPDLIMVLPYPATCPTCGCRAEVQFVEAKAPGKKATPLQNHMIEQIRKAGGIAYVCDDEGNLKPVSLFGGGDGANTLG